MGKQGRQIAAFFQHGRRLHAAGHLVEAELVYHQVLAEVPNHVDATHMVGVLLLETGQAETAIKWIDRAIALNPPGAHYQVHRADALVAAHRFDEAIASCQEALSHKRKNAAAFQTMGHAFNDSGRAEEAICAYREAIRLQSDLPDIHNNLGTALRNALLLEEAERCLREARRRSPNDPGVSSNLSSVLKELGKFDEAEACLRAALQRHPASPVLRFNLGSLMLLTGRFAEGWSLWEARFAAGAIAGRNYRRPRWTGEPLGDRILLVHAEQGLGAIMQFVRYLPLLIGNTVFEVPGGLIRLLSSMEDAPRMVASGNALPAFDLTCPLLSLAGQSGTRSEHLPCRIPYLHAEADRVAHWHGQLRPEGFKVGIAWQGNPAHHEDKGRSIPLARFAPLAAVSGVRLISLQKENGVDQLETAANTLLVETLSPELDAGSDMFIDTAAVMMNLDLIITSDTSIAHLAGALGRPVWLALRLVPDWRWMLHRPDTPWYPTMRLFRAPRRGAWEEVFATMAEELAELVAARRAA